MSDKNKHEKDWDLSFCLGNAIKYISSKENVMNDKNKYEHVSYYANGRKYEPIDVIQDWDLSFCLGNAVKYISRAGRKINIRDDDDLTGADICKAKISDLNKAKQYIQYEIDRTNTIIKECVGDDSQRNTNTCDSEK